MLGYPEAALANAHYALKDAREIAQATTLMFALNVSAFPLIHCGDYDAANAQLDEAVALTDEKGAAHWKAEAIVLQGCVFALTGKASNAIEMINSGLFRDIVTAQPCGNRSTYHIWREPMRT